MKLNPVKGTNDYLPQDASLRDELSEVIASVYRKNGFQRIYTPVLEDGENLSRSEGGENLGLVYRVLKRGAKLDAAVQQLTSDNAQNLSDLGLRYDLTLPLSRFYACHKAALPNPFKVIQIDRVYRAEQPQQGRMREFWQCDIDILGTDSQDAEIELITVTAQALLAIGLEGFTIRLNDRKILSSLLTKAGFPDDSHATVCISLDKLDKIGDEGVIAELAEKGYDPSLTRSLLSSIREGEGTEPLDYILNACKNLSQGKYNVLTDLTLVRGQGYYTGTVFEIGIEGYPGSIGGGGRYDGMVSKFISQDVPAVGFSIGFERIFSILKEQYPNGLHARSRLAVFYEADFSEAWLKTSPLRDSGDVTLLPLPKKLGAALNRLEEQGYTGFMVLGRDDQPRLFGQGKTDTLPK
jgi:histidyl-tRNA synthetase